MARACPHCGAQHSALETRCPSTGRPIAGDPRLVGTTVAGRYHLVRLLGDGGMGAVFKAADQVLRRFVAIKLLHPTVANNPSSVDRFEREARAAAAIGHPNIIDILDFGVEKKRPYMVMEYLRGRSLAQIISQEGALTVRRACTIATHTLAGLAAAHERGILHRDLKPANLMLVARFGDRNFVKVCDFGFAALFGGSERSADGKTLTPERTLVGTPAYAAPERLRGDDRRDPRTDVYSVGVVLWEMLAGVRPFDAPTFAELARKVRNDPPPALRAQRKDIPEGLVAVIERALAKTREERWLNAGEFAAALVPFGGRTIQIDDDDMPSDSFTFEMMQIRARDRKKPRSSLELHESTRPPDSASSPVPFKLDRRREAALDIPIEVEVPRFESAEYGRPTTQHVSMARQLETSPAPPPETDSSDDDGPGETVPNFQRFSTGLRDLVPKARFPIQVVGRTVIPVLRFVSRKFGERALKELLTGLPAHIRAEFDSGIAANAWIDYDVLHSLVEQIDVQLGENDLHIVLECGRASAEALFPSLDRVRQTGASTELLIADIPTLLEELTRGLTLEVKRLGKGYGRLTLVETGEPSLTTCVLMLGILERSLSRFGAEDVEVNLLGARALEDPESLIDISWLS